MYYIKKKFEISASHYLCLNYESKCSEIHGHNWWITVHCKSQTLDKNGMVIDFTLIKQKIKGKLDHKNLNKIFDFNPTAENIAYWICNEIPKAYRVDVKESEGNTASYEI